MNVRLAVKSLRLFVGILSAVACLLAAGSKAEQADKPEKSAANSMVGKKAGQVCDDNALKMKLVWCPPGNFTMGSPPSEHGQFNNADQVDVTLTNGFWLGKFEVTQSEWKQVMATEPWKGEEFPRIGPDFPATYVSWGDAMEFCRKFTERERKAGRVPDGWEYTLPTEAQWEYACRARTESKFSFGDDGSKLADYAWFRENATDVGEEYAHQVGQKKPNPWGMYDMHGNVFEWCRDIYADNLPGGRDPEVTEDDSVRISRGGCLQSEAWMCGSAIRHRYDAEALHHYLGFRVALSSIQPGK